jgi:hypothetical protein
MKTLGTSLVLALVLSVASIGCGSDSKKVNVIDAASDYVSNSDVQPGISDTARPTDVTGSDALGSETGTSDALVQDDGAASPDVAKDAPANSDVSVASDARVD